MYYSSELTPPPELTEKIAHELNAIRCCISSKRPEISFFFSAPWEINTVKVCFNDTVGPRVVRGDYHEWDTLLTRFSIIYYFDDFESCGWSYILQAGSTVHPQRLSQILRSLPGVTYAAAIPVTDEPMQSWSARKATAGATDYYVRIPWCEDTLGRIFWIQASDGSATLHREYNRCTRQQYEFYGQLPWQEFVKKRLDYIRLATRSRPDWINTAEAEFNKVNIFGPNNEWRSLYQK